VYKLSRTKCLYCTLL